MYKRVLVPLDGSKLAEQVLPYVRVLARGLGAKVDLIRAFSPSTLNMQGPQRGAYLTEVSPTPAPTGNVLTKLDLVRALIPISDDPVAPVKTAYLDEVAASVRGQALDYLETIAAIFKPDNLETGCIVRDSEPAPCIVAEAQVVPATLIAISTRGYSGLTRWILGSTTEKVLLSTSNPLLVIPPPDHELLDKESEVRLRTAIVTLDGSSLAEQVLPHITTLAKALALKVVLVSVTPTLSDYYRYGGFYSIWHHDNAARTADIETTRHLEEASRYLRREGVIEVETKVMHGTPAAAILNLARNTPDSLIAMTTHGRSGLDRWVLGSVSDQVVRRSPIPVLLIRAV